MTVSYDTDAAILPLLGAFGEPVRLPDSETVVLAIVDFAQVDNDAPFGKPVQSNNWHLTMWEDHAGPGVERRHPRQPHRPIQGPPLHP